MSNKFKHPPAKPSMPYIPELIEPEEFLPPEMIRLGRYHALKLGNLELPPDVNYADLYIEAELYDLYGNGSDSSIFTIYYPPGTEKKLNPYYKKQMKARAKQQEENEHKMAAYKEQLAAYKKAKKEYDAFWTNVAKEDNQ